MEIIKIFLTTFLSVISLFIIAKAMGHKQMAQLDFFDYITGITIGSIASELAINNESPWKPLIALIIYGTVSIALSIITSHYPRSRKYINGTPTIIMNNGNLYRKNMKKARLDLTEFMVMCRQEGYFDINDIQTAIFEYNGKLTVLPKSEHRPVTPSDMKLTVKSAHITTEVIMDGRILHDNLNRMGLDIKWLEKELHSHGYKSAKEIFLAICDKDKKLSFF
ncbi:MAG: DUF421 domain-containing protein [Lachnospiraceae bacterium]|nr:DUF421 domain-containing protein [Lachnospiraceae bacterium]